MGEFTYTARNRRGEPFSGTITADTPEAVAEQLFNNNLTPIEIEVAVEKKDQIEIKLSRLFKPKVKPTELILLCRQLYSLLKAGVPIIRGLQSLVETTRNPTLADALADVTEDIRSGREFNAALARQDNIFPPLFVSLVRVGESTGRLDESFQQLAVYLEQEKETRDHIKTATRYPLTVFGAIILAMVIINIWVIPAFADAFAKFNTELPLATRILIGISQFTLNYWHLLLLGSAVAIFGLNYWLRTEQGQYLGSRYLLRMPMIGHILLKATLGRFARSLSLTLRSGVPLVQALTVISEVVENAFVSERILGMRNGIESGDSINRTATATGLFTPLVLQMIAIGEETGAVDALLLETAEHYEREVEYELKRLADAIEPVIIMIIGLMVMILALGVFLPMWDLSSAVNRG